MFLLDNLDYQKMARKKVLHMIYNEDVDHKKKLPKCTYTENYIFFDYEAQQETGIHIPIDERDLEIKFLFKNSLFYLYY